MDRARFEIIGSVDRVDMCSEPGGETHALISILTIERQKSEEGDWSELSARYQVRVKEPSMIARIESRVKVGTRIRVLGRLKITRARKKVAADTPVDFLVDDQGALEILALSDD